MPASPPPVTPPAIPARLDISGRRTTDDTILSISGLRVAYRLNRGSREALKSVTADIRRERVTAIIGESGSGKSTLAHAIVRLMPDNAQMTSGSIRFGDQELTTLSARALRSLRGARIGFVPQDSAVSLNPTSTVGTQLREAYRLARTSLSREQVDAQIAADLTVVGFADPDDAITRYPYEFSGGQRQRLLVSMAFSQRPSLVIADEPTSALDALVARDVLGSMDQIRREHHTTVVIITHDLALAARQADDVIVLRDGQVVEQGEIETVFAAPQHEYTRTLLRSVPRINGHRVRSIAEICADRKSPFTTSAAEPAVELIDVKKTFVRRGGIRNEAVSGVSLSVATASTFALVGESGSGKTTTSRMILGLTRPDAGTVRVFGTDLTELNRGRLRHLRREMQPVYQSPYESLDPRHSLNSIIAEPLHAFGIGSRRQRSARVRELLDLVRLPADYASRHPTELSGGQRQRVAIARALALQPRLLVLDEPVSALDATIQAQIIELLLDIQREFALTYFLVTHDLSVVADIADHVAVMHRGRLVEQGQATQIIGHAQHEYTRALLSA